MCCHPHFESSGGSQRGYIWMAHKYSILTQRHSDRVGIVVIRVPMGYKHISVAFRRLNRDDLVRQSWTQTSGSMMGSR